MAADQLRAGAAQLMTIHDIVTTADPLRARAATNRGWMASLGREPKEVGAIRIDRTQLKAFVGSARGLLAIYLVGLALIAFWPTPVDRGAGAFLLWLGRVVPLLGYARVEFLANIVLFVPLGLLAARLLPSAQRYLVLPIGFVVTVLIETVQAAALSARTSSLYDIIANTTGTCLGLLVAVWWDYRSSRQNDPASR